MCEKKGSNPPKRKVSEQSKDASCEQQNAPCKYINEDVVTKKQQDVLKTCNKMRHDRVIDTLRECNRLTTSVQHDVIQVYNRHVIVCKDTLRRVRIKRSSRYRGVTTLSSRYGGA